MKTTACPALVVNIDCASPKLTRSDSTYKSGNSVQTNGATSSGLLFVGSGSNTAGYFYAYDAKTGEELWKFNTGAGIFSSPAVYMVNGESFVTVASGGGDRGRRGGDLILSFALPKR